jgi:hypothetical protein
LARARRGSTIGPISPTPRLVKRIGLAIAATGPIAAAAVYATAGTDPEADPLTQQREMRELARFGGTATVQTVLAHRWTDGGGR